MIYFLSGIVTVHNLKALVTKLNNKDTGVKLTFQSGGEQQLLFLDCTIFVENTKLHTKSYLLVLPRLTA